MADMRKLYHRLESAQSAIAKELGRRMVLAAHRTWMVHGGRYRVVADSGMGTHFIHLHDYPLGKGSCDPCNYTSKRPPILVAIDKAVDTYGWGVHPSVSVDYPGRE